MRSHCMGATEAEMKQASTFKKEIKALLLVSFPKSSFRVSVVVREYARKDRDTSFRYSATEGGWRGKRFSSYISHNPLEDMKKEIADHLKRTAEYDKEQAEQKVIRDAKQAEKQKEWEARCKVIDAELAAQSDTLALLVHAIEHQYDTGGESGYILETVLARAKKELSEGEGNK